MIIIFAINFKKNSDLSSFSSIQIYTKGMTVIGLMKYLHRYFFTSISNEPIPMEDEDKDGSKDGDKLSEIEKYRIYNTLSVPTESLYLKLNYSFPESIFDELEKNLLSIESDQDVSITNMKRLERDLGKAELYLRLFNIFVLILLFLLAFFLLLVFFLNMIRERRWEFAVLRAIGYKLRDIRGIYLLEIGSNVLSALLLGALTGFMFSTLSALQFSTFNEIKLK
jgi:ABC-type antimicrobial peptide transport system permease subunit